MGSCSRRQCRKIPNSPFHQPTETRVHKGPLPLKQTSRILKQLLYIRQTRKKKPTSKWLGEAETQSGHKPHPQRSQKNGKETHNLETLNLSLKSKRFEPHIWYPSFEDLHLRNQLPKHLALKDNWGEKKPIGPSSIRLQWSKKYFLPNSYGFIWLTPHPRTCTDVTTWNAWFSVKEAWLLILKLGLKGQMGLI